MISACCWWVMPPDMQARAMTVANGVNSGITMLSMESPPPEPEPQPRAADSGSWSGSGDYDEIAIALAPLPVPVTSGRNQTIQTLLLIFAGIALIWGVKHGMKRLIMAWRLRKRRKAREIAYRVAKAKGARKALELIAGAFVRPWRKVGVHRHEEDDTTWVQESVLTVLRVEHLPACMDGNFDAMVRPDSYFYRFFTGYLFRY